MQRGLEKLRKKTESTPKFTATQVKKVVSSVFTFDLNSQIDATEVVKICKKYQTAEFREKKTESVYAWRSEYLSTYDNKIPEFSKLFQAVENKIELIWKTGYSFMLHHFWYAIYQNSDSAKVHDHGWVDFACVYYAQVPDKSAPLVIPSSDQDIIIKPKVGQLVVFPGNCDHSVPPSLHEGERIIVAMNVVKDKLLTPDKTF